MFLDDTSMKIFELPSHTTTSSTQYDIVNNIFEAQYTKFITCCDATEYKISIDLTTIKGRYSMRNLKFDKLPEEDFQHVGQLSSKVIDLD